MHHHLFAAFFLACASSLAFAQTPAYPAKPVRIVIPVPPGGVQDLLARGLSQELTQRWGQSVVTENRPGAGGVSAADSVAKSAPDGHSIFMADEVPFAITPLLISKLPYDPIADFAPVIALVQSSHVLVVASGSSAQSLKDLIAQARARPGEINYGTFGAGSTAHLNTEEFATLAGIKVTHVPYKGGADVMRAVVAGDIQFAIAGLTPSQPLIKQGRLRALAYTGARRLASFPDLPTVAEAGVPGFQTRSWFGWVVPAGTPRAIVERIALDAGRVIQAPEFRDKYLTPAGVDALNFGPDQFAQLLKETRAKYEAQIRRLNFSVEGK
jgi:tripartite-type tricarboxylate transporter receptor subunit TctC